MAKNTVKCKGCGHEIWVGSKIIDGYCHDCYVRGRHLPDDTDQWPGSPKPKPKTKPPKPAPPTSKPLPTSGPSTWRNPFPKLRRILFWPLILITLSFIFKGAFWIKSLTVYTGGEAVAMNVIRTEDKKTFFDKGERLNYEAITRNRRALIEFTSSGASYRMNGEFIYAYRTGRGTLANNFSSSVRADVEMSYNSETDVYKFVIRNIGTDKKLENHRIEDGTYYIVKENNKTYVLADLFGEKTTTDISKNDRIYKFLMKYHMENALYANYLDREASGFSLWGGAFYYRMINIDNPGLMAVSNPRVEFRTYGNRPVGYVYVYHDKKTGIGCHLTLNYHYDNIPRDVPRVADYR
jgi:hypothetical protein